MIKKIMSLARNIRESDIEEIIRMESDLQNDEKFKHCRAYDARRVYFAYVALREYSRLKRNMRDDDKEYRPGKDRRK